MRAEELLLGISISGHDDSLWEQLA